MGAIGGSPVSMSSSSTLHDMPRIGANNLAEYMITANPLRRRQILSCSKLKNEAAGKRYRKAYGPITAFLEGGGNRPEEIDTFVAALRREASALEGAPGEEPGHAADDHYSTACALEAFLELADSLSFDGTSYTQPAVRVEPCLTINGIAVMAQPDIVLHFQENGQPCVGGIKFSFPHANNLNDTGCEYAAMLVHRGLAASHPGMRVVPSRCLSVDVFRSVVVSAPRNSVQKYRRLEASANEIALVWPSI